MCNKFSNIGFLYVSMLGGWQGLVDTPGSLQKNWIKFWLSGSFVAVVFALLAEVCWKNLYC